MLTVAVSLSAGVSAIVSALPDLNPYRVPIALAFVLLLTLTNLRGLRESGVIFSIPTYAFLLTIFTLIIVGGYRILTGSTKPPNWQTGPRLELWPFTAKHPITD